ncbi:MAG TPA: general secretion pathway protein [Chromatiales bacterium]|nr:general secretion pathway protein [Chromatiales bacterium]
MYKRFYGLREKPFTLLPDPRFLYLGQQHSVAYAMLEYGLTNQAGFSVIIGDVGCGKTTLIRHLLNEVEDNITVGLMSSMHNSYGRLLQWVMMAFDQPYRNKSDIELFDLFTDFIIGEYAKGRRTVLIVDEAQNLQLNTLEELRMLSNINADQDQVIQLILVGQPQLREMLKRPELEQFAQRIAVDYYLTSFSEEETAEYIHHRTLCVGQPRKLFSDAACKLVHKAARGTPRLINIICDTALVYGYAENKAVIDEAIIQSVVEDKTQTGIIRLTDGKDAEEEPQTKDQELVGTPYPNNAKAE